MDCHSARPYSESARAYDLTLGIPVFLHLRRLFPALVRRYGIEFGSAADVGCGTGLFACYLSRCWGVPVFAVDISPDMLRVAARNCRGANVRLLRQDIRCLRLPCPVDLITANFDTLNHLVGCSDLAVALRRFRENLRPGGHLVFDLVTTCGPPAGRSRHVRRFVIGGGKMVRAIHWDPERQAFSVFVLLRSRSSPWATVEAHRERPYSPRFIARSLASAGFVIRGIHDATTGRVAARCAPRIVVVATSTETESCQLR